MEILKIKRSGLSIFHTCSLEPSQGSYDVPVSLENDDTYTDYTISMYVGYYVNGVLKKRKCETDSEGHYLIPGVAFLRSGIISISFLLETSEKSQGLMTNALSYDVKHAPNVAVDVPTDPTWHELVKEWIKDIAGSVSVDNTLTQPGKAADAKATGDAISKLSEEIANVGKPTDEQVASAVNDYIKDNGIDVGGMEWGRISNGEVFELSTEEEPAKPVPCTGITLDKATLSFSDLETTETLIATVEPFDTTDQVIWSIDNEEVATLENGVITPIKDGNAIVTVTCGRYSATCEITVKIIASYTKTNLDGYFDFTDVEDGYFGTITNKATNGTLQGEIYNEVAYEQSSVYGGVKNGILRSGTSPYMGAIGNRVTLRVSKPETGIFYQAYPYTVEVYGAMHGGFSGENTTNDLTYTTLVSAIMNSRYVNRDNFSSRGTTVYFTNDSTIVTGGAIAMGSNTFNLDGAIDITQYHHYVVCVDSALVRVYIDGVMIGEGTAVNNDLSGANAPLTPMMSGFVKMCRVYNAILTDEQVANNYSHTIGTYGGEA